jgi:uncharacterized glyoxalase superfamily protein PhnB
MEINIAVLFEGKALEALRFYEDIFGVKANNIVFYSGEHTRGGKTYPSMQRGLDGKIRNATLQVGNIKLRFMDFPEKYVDMQGEKIVPMLIDTPEKIVEYYERLTKDCLETLVPLTQTPFSDAHAVVRDKFGLLWALDGGYKFL